MIQSIVEIIDNNKIAFNKPMKIKTTSYKTVLTFDVHRNVKINFDLDTMTVYMCKSVSAIATAESLILSFSPVQSHTHH